MISLKGHRIVDLTWELVSRVTRMGRPVAIYLHPWEFDPDQPRIPAPAFKKFRHYVGLSRSLDRLDAMIGRWPFGTMREVLEGEGALRP